VSPTQNAARLTWPCGERFGCGWRGRIVVPDADDHSMTDRERRIARARLLRREGKTYDEIRMVIGPVDDETLRGWLLGIPRPPETNRTRRKDALRRECRRLRAQGLTIPEIAEKTGTSKGSVSPWVADVTPPAKAMQRRLVLNEEARRRVGETHRRRASERREALCRRACEEFGETSERDLFVVGVALYWAEGAKAKPWRRGGSVDFINSDVDVLRTYLSWLDLLGIPDTDRKYRLSIHESADVAASERWWSQHLGFPIDALARTVLKRHQPLTVRRNIGDDYHGCLRVQVARSGELYCAIEGWWRALADGSKPRVQ
jgi:transcriptional regulator with XRE-family HTH domain